MLRRIGSKSTAAYNANESKMGLLHPDGDEQCGLPPEVLRELEAELADHAASARESCALPLVTGEDPSTNHPQRIQVVRQLGQVHAFSQLGEQALRLPSTPGLYGMLGFSAGMLLAVLGDRLASMTDLALAAWFLQAFGWGIAAGGAVYCLQRAWRSGPGVALARWLQLGTLLAAALLLALQANPSLSAASNRPELLQWQGVSLWLNASNILNGCSVVCILLLIFGRWRLLPIALGLLCSGIVQFYGGPLPARLLGVKFQSASAAEQPAALLAGLAESASQPLSRLLPVSNRWHRLGQNADLALSGSKFGAAGRVVALSGELAFSPRVLLRPVPDVRLSSMLLSLLMPVWLIAGLAAAVVLQCCFPASFGRRALSLSALATSVILSPYLLAFAELRERLLVPGELMRACWQRLVLLATDVNSSGLVAFCMLAGWLLLLCCLRLSIRPLRSSVPRLMLRI